VREELHRCFPLLQRVLRVVLVAVVTCDLRGRQRGGGRGRYNSLKMRLTTRRREHALRAFVVVLVSTSLIHKEMGTPRLTRALFCFASLFLTKFEANPHFVWRVWRKEFIEEKWTHHHRLAREDAFTRSPSNSFLRR
jgi:hypothetical protein